MQTYCSENFSHRLYNLPRAVGLAPHPPNLTTVPLDWLPVLHTQDAHPIRFYYYAEGCSDLFLRPKRLLLALNRVDALFRLAPKHASEHLRSLCRPSDPLHPILHQLRTPKIAANGPVSRTIKGLTGQGCLNDILYQLLEGGGYDVLVLNYEFSGNGLYRKAEVMQVHDAPLFDRHGKECSFHRTMRCLHCGNRTPLTLRVCSEARTQSRRSLVGV